MAQQTEFIPYEQALELKELGFDEPCMSSRDVNNGEGLIQLPLYQQVFRWFREKYGLYHHIVPEFYTKGINFNWQILWYLPKEEWTNHVISDGTALYGDNGEYPTQEQAELACLRKLIQIVKQKQQ